jgi:Flp pilus assembly protein TadD
MHFAEAEADCNKALQREPTAKTLLRRATARRGMRDLEGARRDLKEALQMEPQNRCALDHQCKSMKARTPTVPSK